MSVTRLPSLSWLFTASLNVLLIPSISFGQATVLNFDELPGSIFFFSGSFIPVESRLSTGYLSTFGVQFTSTAGYVGVMQLGSGHAFSGLNALSGATINNQVTYSNTDPIYATFFDPLNIAVPGVTDFVSIKTDLSPAGGTLILKAFDVNGLLLGSASVQDTGGASLTVNFAGIHSVEFDGNGSTAVDDFTFNPVVSGVPEPGSLALMSVTLAGVAVCCYRSAQSRRLTNESWHSGAIGQFLENLHQ